MLDRVHGGNIWPYLRSKNNIIDFSANINPLGLSKKAKRLIVKNLDKLVHYPDPESKQLKKSLAKFYNISTYNLLMGNGSTELIYLIPKALKSKSVLIPIPSFSEYEFAARTNGAKIYFIKNTAKNKFKIEISKLKKFIPKVDLIFLGNPNNPTGSFLTCKEILSLLAVCQKYGVTLVVDEVFMDFVPYPTRFSLLSKAVQNKYLLVLKSLTKFFALSGLRLGYLIGHRSIINKISQFQYPWNVNSLAQVIGTEVIKEKRYIQETDRLILKEKAYLLDNLERIKGITVFPASANFILCKLINSKIKNVMQLSKKLIKEGILIRRCDNFRGLNNRFFRIAIRKREENFKFISAIKCILN